MPVAHRCGCSSMVERELPKLYTRVRFPSPAPKASSSNLFNTPKNSLPNPDYSYFLYVVSACLNFELKSLKMMQISSLPCEGEGWGGVLRADRNADVFAILWFAKPPPSLPLRRGRSTPAIPATPCKPLNLSGIISSVLFLATWFSHISSAVFLHIQILNQKLKVDANQLPPLRRGGLGWGIKVRSQCGNIDCFRVCETPTQPPPSQEEEHTCNLCNSLQTIKFIWNHHLSFVLSHLV